MEDSFVEEDDGLFDSDDDMPLAEWRPLARIIEEDEEEEQEVVEEEEEPLFVRLLRCQDTSWLPQYDVQTGPLLVPALEIGNEREITPYECFSQIIDEEVVMLFVDETNRFASQFFVKHPKNTLSDRSLAKKWYDVTPAEMRAFLGVLYLMGYLKLPAYNKYWTIDPLLEIPGFRKIMSRDRFTNIMRFFHVADNSAEDQVKTHKIKPLVDILLRKWQAAYTPEAHISVDESIIAFKGRSGMRTYNPKKPHKWGIKAWTLAEASTGYIYNWAIYEGAVEGGEVGLTKRVVLELTEPFYGTGAMVFMDNYFSSPELYKELATVQLGACGTLRSNRTGTPDAIKNAKLEKGGAPLFVRKGQQLFIAWHDKRPVNLLTTINNDETVTKTVRCKNPETNFQRTIIKPAAIECYNQHMGGVDLADQKLWVYLNVHRTVKWWRKICIYLLEASFVNASIIYKAAMEDNRIDYARFRIDVVKSLIQQHLEDKATTTIQRPPNPNVPTRLVGRDHWPEINKRKTPAGRQSYLDCVVCTNRVKKMRGQTEYICGACGVALHPNFCFQRYHTVPDYKLTDPSQLPPRH
jgi:hypothetical protein